MIKAILLTIAVVTFCSYSFSQSSIPQTYNDRILVVGGGGARGAWGAGYAKHLTEKYGPYRKAYGTSTGSLMIPLIVLNEFNTLEESYTGVTQQMIFNVNPFNKKTGEIRKLNAVWRVLIGKQSLGESKNLRQTITRFMPEELYNKINQSSDDLEIVVTVVDFKTGQAEYKSSQAVSSYDEMVNWMWASANEPIFMSYYNVGDKAYVDGGVMENVPLEYALKYALDNRDKYRHIDVIINKPLDPIIDKEFPKRNILKGVSRLIELFSLEIRNDDLFIPELQAAIARYNRNGEESEPSISIEFHYFPSEAFTGLNVNELLFDKTRMSDLWELGSIGVKDGNQFMPVVYDVPVSVLKDLLNK